MGAIKTMNIKFLIEEINWSKVESTKRLKIEYELLRIEDRQENSLSQIFELVCPQADRTEAGAAIAPVISELLVQKTATQNYKLAEIHQLIELLLYTAVSIPEDFLSKDPRSFCNLHESLGIKLGSGSLAQKCYLAVEEQLPKLEHLLTEKQIEANLSYLFAFFPESNRNNQKRLAEALSTADFKSNDELYLANSILNLGLTQLLSNNAIEMSFQIDKCNEFEDPTSLTYQAITIYLAWQEFQNSNFSPKIKHQLGLFANEDEGPDQRIIFFEGDLSYYAHLLVNFIIEAEG